MVRWALLVITACLVLKATMERGARQVNVTHTTPLMKEDLGPLDLKDKQEWVIQGHKGSEERPECLDNQVLMATEESEDLQVFVIVKITCIPLGSSMSRPDGKEV